VGVHKGGTGKMNQKEFRRAVAKTYDNSDLYIELILKGKIVAYINNIPKVWDKTKNESIREYLDFEYNGISEDNNKKQYLLSAGAMRIIFDDFEEHWI